jgi:hypothetical protein
MRCPHCLEGFQADLRPHRQVQDDDGDWDIHSALCPSCNRATIFLTTKKTDQNAPYREIRAWPKDADRLPLPPEVIEPYASDYYEACLVLADSPRASAALSRRCLQALLRDKADVRPGDLRSEIDQALASKTLPPQLATIIGNIPDVGNFAAHPFKSTHPGLVLAVEPGEADYILDVLEGLFEFYLVRSARRAAERDALKEKPSAWDPNLQGRARSVRRIMNSVSAASRD